MGQPLRCDTIDCDRPVAVIVSATADGSTDYWCGPCFLAFCTGVAESSERAAAEQAAAELADRLAGTHPPAGEDMFNEPAPDDATTEAPAEPPAFPTSAESSDAVAAAPEPPTRRASGHGRRAVARTASPVVIAPPEQPDSPTEATEP